MLEDGSKNSREDGPMENAMVVMELGAFKSFFKVEFELQEARFRSIMQEYFTGVCTEETELHEVTKELQLPSSDPSSLHEVNPEAGAVPEEADDHKSQEETTAGSGPGNLIKRNHMRKIRAPSFREEFASSKLGRKLIEGQLGQIWQNFGKHHFVDEKKLLNRILLSKSYSVLSTLMVVWNGFQLGYSSQYAVTHVHNPTNTFIDAMDVFFCIWYLTELVMHLCVFRWPFFYNNDWKWNWFDTFLVVLAIYEELNKALMDESAGGGSAAGIARLVRLVKSVKMLRFIHAMHFFRELRHFLVPIVQSVRSLLWTILMLGLILYIFSIIFLQGVAGALSDSDVDLNTDDLVLHFGTVKDAMTSLYMAITGGNDWSLYSDLLYDVGLPYYYFFFFYIAFCTFAVLNILTGIFVDNAMQFASEDRSLSREDLAGDEMFKMQVLEELQECDSNNDGELSLEELESRFDSPLMSEFFSRLEITHADASALLRRLLASRSELDLEAFLDCAIYIKGTARGVHLHELMAESTAAKQEILAALQGLEQKLTKSSSALQGLEHKLEHKLTKSISRPQASLPQLRVRNVLRV